MAGFILSETSGFADSIYGKSAYPISMIMEQGLESFENKSIANKVFSKHKSKHFAEKMTALSAMDDWTPTGENSAAPTVGMTEVFSKVFEHVVWRSKFSITREMVDDNNIDLMSRRASKMVQAYGRTKEKFAASLLAGATGSSITFNGTVFDTTTADGVPLFSTAHPNFYNASVTQSNMFSDAFDISVLGELETVMQQFTGDKGEILGISPDTIIIPNDATIKNAVFSGLGADKDPGTAASNAFNYQYGRWNILINPYWVLPAGSSDKPFILFDSNFNEVDGTAVWWDRIPMECKARVDEDTDAAIYQGYARFTAGFNNFRGMLMGGVTGGTSL